LLLDYPGFRISVNAQVRSMLARLTALISPNKNGTTTPSISTGMYERMHPQKGYFDEKCFYVDWHWLSKEWKGRIAVGW